MIKEFRDFINRGSELDLAVAVIIGAAFGAIIASLVADIITPLIGVILGGINLAGQTITIGQASIGWGNFVQAIINFVIVAFVMFLIVRTANRMKKEAPATPVAPTPDQKLLTEIRDLLKAGR